MNRFHSEAVVNSTRKPYCCDWCGEAITVGSRAHKFFGYFEDTYRGYMHPECTSARNDCDWVAEDGYQSGMQARGRRDDERGLPPEFTPEGTEITTS